MTEYSETVSVLQALYQDEVRAYNNYLACAKKAASEKYEEVVMDLNDEVTIMLCGHAKGACLG